MLAAHPPNASVPFPLPADYGGNANQQPAPQASENRVCPGCKNTVMTEDGGVVVAFGQSFFHVDCFKCAKCNNKVTADTNLLLLSDGSPVCANCSYSCNVCGQPILDEAIMTGDDSYHAHCFNCKVCKKRIDELVFAKTSQGIYCMDCHNERVARSRRHQQRREKEKRDRAAAEGSVNSRGSLERERPSGPTPSPPIHPPSLTPSHPSVINRVSSPRPTQDISSSNSAPPSATVNPDHARSVTAPRNDTLNLPDRDKTLQKRKSYDDRPLNMLLKEGPPTPHPQANGLAVPDGGSSRAEKRRSINPAFALSFSTSEPASTNGPPPAYNNASTTRTETSAASRLPSPLREHFSPTQPMPGVPASLAEQDEIHGRARSASSDRVPARTSSRLDHTSVQDSPPPGFTPISTESGRRYQEGWSPGAGSPLRQQKSFDERRPGSSSLRNSSSSINLGQTIVVPTRDNSQPTSPSHRVDVPHGVESGTDTEGEPEDTSAPEGPSEDDMPPLPPPKEVKGAKHGTRPPELKLKTDDIENDNSELLNDEDLSSELSHESSPVEQTSHATFIAPALPPIRFSMSGADFGDLLRSVGSPSTQKPPMRVLKEVSNEGPNGLSVNTTLTPPAYTKQVSTPTSDITIISSETPYYNDATPVKRRDNVAKGDQDQTVRRDPASQRSNSPSPQSLNQSSTYYNSSVSRTSSDIPNGHSESSRSSEDVPRLDVQADRGRPRPKLLGPSLDRLPSLQRDRDGRDRSVDSAYRGAPAPPIRMTASDSSAQPNGRLDAGHLVKQRLQEAVSDANARKVSHVKLNLDFVDAILMLLDQRKDEVNDLKKKLDGMKRASQQYMDGLTVAQTEYDAELKARREAEAEVTRLRVLLSGQAVRLSVISGESKRQEAQRERTRKMSDSLSQLERNLSKLKVERDLTLAEVEELSANKSIPSAGDAPAKLGRALSVRFDSIKSQYEHQLLPLTQERETLIREVEDLKACRESFLEETTMLNARNEELAQLNAQYIRRMEASGPAQSQDFELASDSSHENKADLTANKIRMLQNLSSSLSSSVAGSTEESDSKSFHKVQRLDIPDVPTPQHKVSKFGMKWGGSKTPKDHVPVVWPDGGKQKVHAEHTFVQISVLRPQRCDHCGDKMWGSQLRCTRCNIAVHTRCVHHVHLSCSQSNGRDDVPQMPNVPDYPSILGRELAEQVRADSRTSQRLIPVIVEKCIDAVDFLGLEYEGIYRKSGGTRLVKVINNLFDRGDYDAFDLRDTDEFNDICSITSVLKTYFRQMPDPLLTFDLHDRFIEASSIKEPTIKTETMRQIVSELPSEHYYTARALMLHLHRVREKSDINLMHARNLGVVFGPTLMRSRDTTMEFSDMAGKALSVEWLVEHAPEIFNEESEQTITP
ncbi:hypothetical protein EUX98_g894 [Antrodiella citrinella]|uniref:RhoGAP-domain-containing protein n=1 Tax=Antrodiella citrinella TaxID=2447956 RepID=A0A4S4N5M7_9APHY|nr:hypothetical protein EUX98_g894 [Antrodiella citrinella]